MQSSGDYQDGDIANIDQKSLPFILDDGKTYDIKGVKEVWAQSGQSGLDKRQATVQLTVFADGVDRLDLQSSSGEKAFESLQRRKCQRINA